jgi:hypothetical protein
MYSICNVALFCPPPVNGDKEYNWRDCTNITVKKRRNTYSRPVSILFVGTRQQSRSSEGMIGDLYENYQPKNIKCFWEWHLYTGSTKLIFQPSRWKILKWGYGSAVQITASFITNFFWDVITLKYFCFSFFLQLCFLLYYLQNRIFMYTNFES